MPSMPPRCFRTKYPPDEFLNHCHVRAVATGEFRLPRKGEWFLSGSYIEAYRAENDLTAASNIAKLAYV